MSLFTWSRTAADNDDADSTINMREGMAPSLVNNGVRAVMAAVAKWRDDSSGVIATGGSASAYTLTTYQTYTSLTDGISVTFRAAATNSAGPTLNVDGLGAKPLRMYTGSSLLAGKIVSGSIYRATYRQSSDEWILLGAFPETIEIASGTKMLFQQTNAPTGWTKDTTHNNKALRVVSGTASSGGSVAFTTAFASKSVAGTVGNTTLTEDQIPSHRHFVVADAAGTGTLTNSNQLLDEGTFGNNASYQLSGTSTDATIGRSSAVGGGNSHTHSFSGTAIDLAVQYVDMIIATKD
jgi:hypothetical protein